MHRQAPKLIPMESWEAGLSNGINFGAWRCINKTLRTDRVDLVESVRSVQKSVSIRHPQLEIWPNRFFVDFLIETPTLQLHQFDYEIFELYQFNSTHGGIQFNSKWTKLNSIHFNSTQPCLETFIQWRMASVERSPQARAGDGGTLHWFRIPPIASGKRWGRALCALRRLT